MNWKNYLDKQQIKTHTTSKIEIDQLRGVVARELKDAKLNGLSSDRSFACSYNAILQLSHMVIACSGYRVGSVPGHHKITIELAEVAMGPTVSTLVAYFDTCRKKRNLLDYDQTEVASKTEATELFDKANEFYKEVESWIENNYPAFKS